MTADHAAADAFARLAVELHDVGGVEETVEAVVQFALRALQCSYAGVLIATGRRPEVLASTHPRVAELYRLQIEADGGPVIAAIRQESVVVVADVAADSRWPAAWAERIRAEGIRSIVHLPLLVNGRAAAVLSLYSDVPEAFDADDLAVAHILARHASIAIANARQEETLAQAIDARKLVGQAMGILMERYDLDSDRSFEVLKRYSQQTNRKLRDVAQELINTRRLPH
ncbi:MULTISPECIES: GAF and ANTAR domain-containing protein [Kribbella]|uniref:GAF and ANTAR domain-containing protein n=1 Tax=Kribbella TaxID=182639 RepID=UPI001050E38C|nr:MULTISPECIES: GAF and ANTAR domain-containing protein [Kribbella]